MLVHVIIGNPASVACSAVDGQRLQKSSYWSPQRISFVDIQDSKIFFLLDFFLLSPFFAQFQRECVCSCSLVTMPVSIGFQSARKYYINGFFEVPKNVHYD